MGAAILPDSTRPPLLPLIDSRSGGVGTDAKLVNGYLEKDREGNIWVNKRPGLVTYVTDPVATNAGLGCYYWTGRNSLIAVTSDGKVREASTTTIGTVADVSISYDFNQTMGTPSYLLLKNSLKAYTYSSTGIFAQITDANYPSTTVPGSAYLDGTMYVMDTVGRIWGSKNLNDPTAWDALNVIVPQIEPDPPTALAKQLIYVVAFMRWTIEFFYDAANPVGTPLLPVQNAKLSMGCPDANSIQMIADELYFIGSNKLPSSGGFFQISNLKLKKISSPAVDKFLAQNNGVSAGPSWQTRRGGHTFYVVPFTSTNLVYDLTEGEWYFWQEAGGQIDVAHSTVNPVGGQEYLQSNLGKYFRYTADFGFGAYYDTSVTSVVSPITADIITPNFDGGTRVKKFLGKLRLVTDQNSAGSLKVCWSDDDYKTWSSWVVVNLQEDTPQLTQLGSFKKRAFWFRHDSPTAFRMSAAEMELLLGNC